MIDLYGESSTFRAEWFNPETNTVIGGGNVFGGDARLLRAPFNGDAVLYLYRESIRNGDLNK